MFEALVVFLLLPNVALSILCIMAILALCSIETESWVWATIIHVFSIWFAFKAFDLPFEWTSVLIFSVAYFVVGALTSLLKWLYLVKKSKNSLLDSCKKNINHINEAYVLMRGKPHPFASTNELISWFLNLTDVPVDCKTDISIITTDIYKDATFKPRCGWSSPSSPKELIKLQQPATERYKPNIIGWIVFWPTVFIWTMIDNPLKRVGTYIYNQLGGTYNRISNSIFKF